MGLHFLFKCWCTNPLPLVAPRFLLENFYLDEHVRYILTIYPVVILWLTGNLDNLDSPGSHSFVFAGKVQHWNVIGFTVLIWICDVMFSFSVFILIMCCIFFLARVILVTWKHQKIPLYSHSEPSMSPVEIALTQSKLFLWLFLKVLCFL